MNVDSDSLLDDSSKRGSQPSFTDSRVDMQKEVKRYKDRSVCCRNQQRGGIVTRLRSLSEHPSLVRILVLLFKVTLISMAFNIVHVHDVIMHLILIHMILYAMVCYISPGYVNSKYFDTKSDIAAPATDSFCARCNRSRPARAHHCLICNRCVLMMDHHCDLTQNCCGEHNLVYYLVYEALSLVISSMGVFAMWHAIFTKFYLAYRIQAISCAVLLTITSVGSGYLLVLHLILILNDMTMIEWFAATDSLTVMQSASRMIKLRCSSIKQVFSRSSRTKNPPFS